MKRTEFTPAYLLALMPSSKKRNAVQVLKRYKNRAIQMCEEAAKNDHDHCTFTMQRLEMGLPLQYDLEEISLELADWLESKGFRVAADPANPLCMRIEWGDRQDDEPQPLLQLPIQPQRAAGQAQPQPISPPMQAGAHPFFNWMAPVASVASVASAASAQKMPAPQSLRKTPR